MTGMIRDGRVLDTYVSRERDEEAERAAQRAAFERFVKDGNFARGISTGGRDRWRAAIERKTADSWPV